MNFSHILSGTILTGMGVGVFWHYFRRISLFNRLLWGVFILTIPLATLANIIFISTENDFFRTVQHYLTLLSNTLGTVSLITSVYALLNRQTLSLFSFLITLFVGLFLFVNVLSPQAQVFTPIIPSLGILIIMLLAVFALLQRNKSGLWIVCAAMMMGLATKVESFIGYIDPIVFYQYATSLALWFFGKAAWVDQERSKRLY